MKVLRIAFVAVVLAAAVTSNSAKASMMDNLGCQTYMWDAWSQCLGWGHSLAECNPIVDTGIPYCARAYPT
jgi:hypothetical protein